MGSSRKLDKRIAAFKKHDPSFDADEFLAQARTVVWQVHSAMGTQQYESAKPLMLPGVDGAINVGGSFASPPTTVAAIGLLDIARTTAGDEATVRANVPTEKHEGVDEIWTFVRPEPCAGGAWLVRNVDGPKRSWRSEHTMPPGSSSGGLGGDD